MRMIISIFFFILAFNMLAAVANPIQLYFGNPTTTTFQNAWNSCNETLAKDSTSKATKILMATMASYESDRLISIISASVNSFDAGTKFQYANLLLSREKYADAIVLYQQLNDSIPDWSCPWRHKGTSYYMQKNYKEAEIALQKAVDTNPEHYDAYIWLAKTQYQLKKYKLALQNLEIGLKLDSKAEENNDSVLSDDSIQTLHKELLRMNGKR